MQVNKRIIHSIIIMSLLFLSLIGYLTYFEMAAKEKILTNPYNRRNWAKEDSTLRGSILDRSGIVLASSRMNGNKQQEREYPYGPLYSQIIGYSSRTYGKSLIELNFNDDLLNINALSAVFDIKNKLTGQDKLGNNLHLTIDHKLQDKAAKLLGNRKGAVAVMNPKTGEILAMVSKPDFSPDSKSLASQWNKLVESQESPFLPRATQGLYVPGSTFKVLVSAAAIEKGLTASTYHDEGSIVIDGMKIANSGGKAYGDLNLKSALALSSNVVFSQVGAALGEDALKDIAARAGIGKGLDFDIPVSRSSFSYWSMSKTDMAAVGIGQGKILVTPLQMAMIASSVANNGIMMKPLLVSKSVTREGIVMWNHKPSQLYKVMEPDTAMQLKDMMQEVVTKGTGKNASISGIHVAGKTGTAENELTGKEKNKEHAWFIGFAPAEDPRIAVAVILEYNGSTGGQAAAPIARDIMADWLRR